MEANRIITKLDRIKDTLVAKIDKVDASITSVKNSVTNLPTTLDSKFSALTSKVDDVKTDVAGVGSKVDDVGTDVEDVKGCVSKIDNLLQDVYPDEVVNVVKSIEKGTLVDIKGQGNLYAVFFSNATGVTDGVITIKVDGVKILDIEFESDSYGQYAGSFFCSNSLITTLSNGNAYYLLTPYDNAELPSGGITVRYVDKTDALINADKRALYISNKPITFNESLVISKSAYSDNSYCSGNVVYSLN